MATTKPSSSSDPSSNLTTYVQADPSTFRALVQKLTGANDDSSDKLPVTFPARSTGKSVSANMGLRRSAFKLQERRQNMRKLEIKLGSILHKGEVLLVSPVSPLDLFSSSPSSSSSSWDVLKEEKAIADKGFYLHPSPLSTPRNSEPELLPLFPLHSPRESSS
ncbi:VQ motif-containing protein 11-like [Tasmannia lanceolata]|uniref:VQ motif-containing protein 11-like n=1 Tax=Tasmannia lanceolata TaxID=3420 RepID=UPI004062C4C1